MSARRFRRALRSRRASSLVPRLALGAAGVLLAGPAAAAPPAAPSGGLPERPNVLLILADDIGVDRIGAYAEHPDPGRTPVIDSLAKNGVLFRNAWATPTCSPSRAMLLTGEYPFRTGVGHALDYEDATFELATATRTFADLVAPVYRTAVVGKWHLAIESGEALQHPLKLGFEHHHGSIANLPNNLRGYIDYDKNVDGELVESTTYATTDTVDDALAILDGFRSQAKPQEGITGPQPWLLLVAFNAAHAPFHAPPEELHGYDLPAQVGDDVPLHFQAMVEALDTEIGRLLAGLTVAERARTLVILTSDNGTDPGGTTPPFSPDKAKTTVYEGGINIPLIVSGPGVAAGECAALVSLVDLYATVEEVADVVHGGGVDSVSLVPYLEDPLRESLREWVYSERFTPSGFDPYYQWRRAVRDGRYKLRYFYDGFSEHPLERELFDLLEDPFEEVDLLQGPLEDEQLEAFLRLRTVMNSLGPP